MWPAPNRVWIAYLIALLSLVAATVIRYSLDPVLGDHLIFSFYYLAVSIAAWAGGVGPALFTAILSSLLANYLFSAPQRSLQIDTWEEFLALLLFLSVSLVIGLLSEFSLRSLARARRAEQQKDDFLAVLAHELRNPLAVIHYTNLVNERAGTQAGNTRAQIIDRQVHQLNQMIDDLLDISRVSRGKFRLGFELVDASEIIDGAVEKTKHLIESRGHQLEVSRESPDMPIWADPLRLEQVLTNLIANAAKYTPKNGKIELRLTQEDDCAVYRIRDNGEGIPKEMLSRVFDLFTQVERSMERSQSGLGIGLALVRTLVELHGGTVAATSEGPDQGSEFIVRMPIRREPMTRPDAPEAGDPKHGSHEPAHSNRL